jgi:hypothetical protein
MVLESWVGLERADACVCVCACAADRSIAAEKQQQAILSTSQQHQAQSTTIHNLQTISNSKHDPQSEKTMGRAKPKPKSASPPFLPLGTRTRVAVQEPDHGARKELKGFVDAEEDEEEVDNERVKNDEEEDKKEVAKNDGEGDKEEDKKAEAEALAVEEAKAEVEH